MKLQDINNIDLIKNNIVMVNIIDTKGSVPRNENVFMIISSDNQFGTIGGGELEYRVCKEAFKLLKNVNSKERILKYPLGPLLGQCCGGYIKIELIKFKNGKNLIEKYDLKNTLLKENKNLYIFGAGHVSNALINKIECVGFNVFVIDSRENLLSRMKVDYVETILVKKPEIILKKTIPNSYYLVMTHSHQLDLLICSTLLDINNFIFIGLIGSKTKKERFNKRLKEMGYSKYLIDKIECPIGIETIKGKEPDIIAISIIGRLLEFRSSIDSKQEKKYVKLIHG